MLLQISSLPAHSGYSIAVRMEGQSYNNDFIGLVVPRSHLGKAVASGA